MAFGGQAIQIDQAEEAGALAQLFLRLSTAVGQFRNNNPGLSDGDKARLDLESQQLAARANIFNAQAIGVTLQALQASLDNLKQVAADAQEAVSTLNDISKVIKVVTIATAAAALAASISAGDIGAIGAALTTLGQAVTG